MPPLYIMALELKKVMFYHVPKTGGTWLREALRASCEDVVSHRGEDMVPQRGFNLRKEHVTPDGLKTDKPSFAAVRDPLKWYQSFFRYRLGAWDRNFILDVKCAVDTPKHPDEYEPRHFQEFMEKVLKEYPDGFVSEMYQRYVGEDLKKVTHIVRQENLTEDVVKMLKLYKEEFDEEKFRNWGHTNASNKKIVAPYTSDLRRRVKKAESWFYDNFK